MWRTIGLTALGLHILYGCAIAPPTAEPGPGWEAHSQQLQALNSWTANGKVALRNSDSAETASLKWQQRGNEATIQISGPLGTGSTLIHSDGKVLHINRGDDIRSVDISTPEAIELNTGWDLPLQALPYWLRGLPSPDSEPEKLQTDAHGGRLELLQQDGWTVTYERYASFDDGALPSQLTLNKGDTRARVLIRRWQSGPH